MYNGEHTRTFTAQAARALTAAQQLAQTLGHNYLGTEHLLLGLLAVSEGRAAEALRLAGVKLGEAYLMVWQLAGQGARYVPWQIGMTARAKEVIEHAFLEVKAAGAHMIDTEHLLLALLQDEGGLARDVLRQLKVDPLVLVGLLQTVDHRAPASETFLPTPSEHENQQHSQEPIKKEGAP